MLSPDAGGRLVLSYRGRQKYTRHVEIPTKGDEYKSTSDAKEILDTEVKCEYDGFDHGMDEGYKEYKVSLSFANPYSYSLPGENIDIPSRAEIPKDIKSDPYECYRKGFNNGFLVGWKKATGEREEWMAEDGGLRDECSCLNFSYNGHPRFKRHTKTTAKDLTSALSWDVGGSTCSGEQNGKTKTIEAGPN